MAGGTNLQTFASNDLKQIHDALTGNSNAMAVPVYNSQSINEGNLTDLTATMQTIVTNATTHGFRLHSFTWAVRSSNGDYEGVIILVK